MRKDLFIGRPLSEVMTEACQQGLSVQEITETLSPKKPSESCGGIPYIVQERWHNESTVSFITALRLSREEVR